MKHYAKIHIELFQINEFTIILNEFYNKFVCAMAILLYVLTRNHELFIYLKIHCLLIIELNLHLALNW